MRRTFAATFALSVTAALLTLAAPADAATCVNNQASAFFDNGGIEPGRINARVNIEYQTCKLGKQQWVNVKKVVASYSSANGFNRDLQKFDGIKAVAYFKDSFGTNYTTKVRVPYDGGSNEATADASNDAYLEFGTDSPQWKVTVTFVYKFAPDHDDTHSGRL